MKTKPLIAVSLSLLLVACSPATQPLFRQGEQPAKPANTQMAPMPETPPAAGQLTQQPSADELRVRLRLPASAAKGARFRTLDALATEAAYVRLVIKAADLSREYTNTGGITLNGVDHLEAITPAEAESGKLLTVPGIPRGSNRLVIAQIYDAQGRELTSLRAMGLFHSRDRAPAGSLRFADENAGTTVIEQTVSRRYLPLLSMLEQAIANDDQDFLDAIENHLDTLAEEFDQLVYGNVTPGPSTPFVVDPQSLDFTEIYTLLSAEVANESFEPETELDAFFTTNQASFTESPVDVVVWLATPTGFDFTQNMKVIIDDPNSDETSVTSLNADSPLSVTVNDVLRGTRRLTVTNDSGLVLGHTTVTIDPDASPQYSFAGGFGSSDTEPLVLIGGETGIVISSIVSPSNVLAEVQGTAMTLNGVGYAETPNHGANIIKFTHNSNGEGAVTVPPTNATTTSVNLNVPDLIGGTYLVTAERLGVVSNSRNFSIVPAVSQIETLASTVVNYGKIGSTLVLRGTGFDPAPANNTVYFGSTPVTPSAAGADGHSLTVTVPAGLAGSQPISVSVGGQTSATADFAIRPTVNALEDDAEAPIGYGVIGSDLVIKGSGFAPTAAGNQVQVAGVSVPEAEITVVSNTELQVKVPANAYGSGSVQVSVGSQSSDEPAAFAITPVITGTSPATVARGESVTVTGTGFAPTTAGNTVGFGINTASVTSASYTELTVTVPNISSGSYATTVQVATRTSAPSDYVVSPLITTVVGTGTAGYNGDNRTAASAQLNKPWGIAIANNHLAISDTDNHRIRLVAGSSGTHFGQSMDAGKIYTLAGDGTAGSAGSNGTQAVDARVSSPRGIVISGAPNLQFADAGNDRFRAIVGDAGNYFGHSNTQPGEIYRIAGSDFSGDGLDDHVIRGFEVFENPHGIARNGNLTVFADTEHDVVRVMAYNNTYNPGKSLLGRNDLDPDRICQLVGHSPGITDLSLSSPQGLMLDADDNLYIADTGNHRVIFGPSQNGTYFGQSMSAGNVYVIAGTGTGGYNGDDRSAVSARLSSPRGVNADARGLFIADSLNHRIRFVPRTSGSYFGQTMVANRIYTIAGTGSDGFSGDGGASTLALLDEPTSIDFDAGKIYFTDRENNRVRMIEP